ncbi:MAG: response regulator transcription factor [Pseudomonadota bacterium]
MQTERERLVARTYESVLIVDDHPLYSDALAAALELAFPCCRIEKAETLNEAIACLEGGFAPELVMFDLKLPDVTGISGFMRLRRHLPDTPVLVISSLASAALVQSLLREGAIGFLPKDSSAQELRAVLARIAEGETHVPHAFQAHGDAAAHRRCGSEMNPMLASLTPQQQKIMRLICAGKPNKQIAYELSLAEATVKAHITALLRRLEVNNRTQAAVLVEAALATNPSDDPEARAFLNR